MWQSRFARKIASALYKAADVFTVARFGFVLQIVAGTLTACAQASPGISVPSGSETYIHEILLDDVNEPPAMRFRYVQPDLSQTTEYEVISNDLFALCQTHAAPEMGKIGADLRQIIVSLSSEPTVFGETRQDVVQVFEFFTYANGQCAWPEVLE